MLHKQVNKLQRTGKTEFELAMENPGDKEQWRAEAEAVIDDIKHHVTNVSISSELPNSRTRVYLNLTTLEGKKYCIELSEQGFRIVGDAFDSITKTDERVFETPYSLLESVSQRFRTSFAQHLSDKLTQLEESQ